MSDEKKNQKPGTEEPKENVEADELDEDALERVTGGAGTLASATLTNQQKITFGAQKVVGPVDLGANKVVGPVDIGASKFVKY